MTREIKYSCIFPCLIMDAKIFLLVMEGDNACGGTTGIGRLVGENS